MKQGVLFFLHVSSVLGMCRGVHVRSHASYAEACTVFPIGGLYEILWSMVQAQLERLVELILTNDGHQYSIKVQNSPLILSMLWL